MLISGADAAGSGMIDNKDMAAIDGALMHHHHHQGTLDGGEQD